MRALLIALVGLVLPGSAAVHAGDAITGPKSICLRYSHFQLSVGETMAPPQMGMHNVTISIDGGLGAYELSESDILRTPELDERVFSKPGMRIHRIRDGALSDFRYAAIGRIENWTGEEQTLVVLGGAAFDDDAGAADIFARLSLGDNADRHCDISIGTFSLE